MKPNQNFSVLKIASVPLYFALFSHLFAFSTVSSAADGVLVEDFSSLSHLDSAETTGFWNIEAHAAESLRVSDGQVTRPLVFGDGSDGVLESDQGYVFDTDTHPQGFNFVSVHISGGNIEVRGSSPLTIRSLSSVLIVPPINLDGRDGVSATGGTASLGLGVGGSGGAAGANNGSNGFQYDGTPDATATGGVGATDGDAGAGMFAVPPSWPTTFGAFDSALWLNGSGGGGGGGCVNGGVSSVGGGGGGGAGSIRIVAAGDLTVGTISARGGKGADGVACGSYCSGPGAGGHGGNVWLQTLKTLAAPVSLVTGGAGGDQCGFGGNAGDLGLLRGDSSTSTSRLGWETAGYDTTHVAPSQTYVLQSKAYDLGTVNAAFVDPPVIEKVENGGQITIQYAGSNDGITFSSFTDKIDSLSYQSVRYLKFRITLLTASIAAPSPKVTRLTIPYRELNFDLSGGCVCGQTKVKKSWGEGLLSLVFWILLWQMLRRWVLRACPQSPSAVR